MDDNNFSVSKAHGLSQARKKKKKKKQRAQAIYFKIPTSPCRVESLRNLLSPSTISHSVMVNV